MKEKKILICDPDEAWQENLAKDLSETELEVFHVGTGKDAQKLLYEEKFLAVIIDIETSSHSAIEVIKYIRFNCAKVFIIVTAKNHKILEQYGLDEGVIRRLGIAEVLVKPYKGNYLLDIFDQRVFNQSWRNIKQGANAVINREEEVEAGDENFTAIAIDEFFCGNLAIFDVFIRLKQNKFLKILDQGDSFDPERIKHYKEKKNVKFLYFKTDDRRIYVSFMNDLVARIIEKDSISDKMKVVLTQNLTEKYVDELYVRGLSENTLEEGRRVCDNIFKTIENNRDIGKMMKELIEYDDNMATHLFLTSFYSSIIGTNLGWVSRHTREVMVMGAFLHDIGKLSLPEDIRNKKVHELNDTEMEEYKKHCDYGHELLKNTPLANEQIKQIVLQHHEHLDGSGFPDSHKGRRIFLMAQIIGFSNWMAHQVVERKSSPYGVIKDELSDRKSQLIYRYSADVIKAFIEAVRGKEKPIVF